MCSANPNEDHPCFWRMIVAVCALAFVVPTLAAGIPTDGEIVTQGNLIADVPQVTSGDLIADIIIVSPEDLPKGVSPSVPGYDPNRELSYEGPRGYEFFYDYGFADRYGRLDYVLPGYSDAERFDLANAYIKYAESPRFTEPHEILVSGINEETGESISHYVTVGPDSAEFLQIMPFEEFLADYETFVVSGQGGIEEYLGVLLDRPMPEEVQAYFNSLSQETTDP